ncbi:MAG TPA: pilus assembly protein MshP [Chromatiales bacterium]|nr:pilus assembly protein MshP [Chromatiales bacterium]
MSHSRRQQGFSLVSAIFLLVVLGMLGGFMVTLGSVQHTSTALSAHAARAHFAALSGLEWMVFRLGSGGGCAASGAAPVIEGFTLAITCSASPVTEGARNYSLYDLRVRASRGAVGALDRVSREVRAVVEGP